MRVKIPMTGTVIDYNPELAALDGNGVSGDPSDPVRPVNLDLGGVAWHLVSIDLENDLMEIEIIPQDTVDVPVLDGNGKLIFDSDGKQRVSVLTLTPVKKQQILANAQHILENQTADEIYTQTGDRRLVKPAEVMEKYRASKVKI